MKNIIFSILSIAILNVSIASADYDINQQTGLSAFENVQTVDVSKSELDEVSGDGLRDVARTAFVRGWQTSAAVVIGAWNTGVDVGNILSGKYDTKNKRK